MQFIRILIVGCLGIFCISSEKPERMAWDAEKPLVWADFKASPDYLLDYVATTNSGLSHSFAISGRGVLDKSSSKVYAHFYPTFSWYKPEDTTDFLLKHEQSHFDITEIHARKLRKRIQEFTFTTNSEEEVKKLYDITEAERRAMQQQFDNETDHSRDRQQEFVWASKIRDLLERYWVYTP